VEVSAETGGGTAEDKNTGHCPEKQDVVAAEGGEERVVLAV